MLGARCDGAGAAHEGPRVAGGGGNGRVSLTGNLICALDQAMPPSVFLLFSLASTAK